MTRWEEYDCRSVPVVCQINKCLMTLSLPLFNLIRGGTDLLDGWLYSNRLWIWSRGLPAFHSLCVLVCSAAAWLPTKPLNCIWPPEDPAVWLQPFEHPAAARLRKQTRQSRNQFCRLLTCVSQVMCVCVCMFYWWITIKYICQWHFLQWQQTTVNKESLQAGESTSGFIGFRDGTSCGTLQ